MVWGLSARGLECHLKEFKLHPQEEVSCDGEGGKLQTHIWFEFKFSFTIAAYSRDSRKLRHLSALQLSHF